MGTCGPGTFEMTTLKGTSIQFDTVARAITRAALAATAGGENCAKSCIRFAGSALCCSFATRIPS